ncbi:hypothetical protein [Actinocrispum wychmicini]|uniref:Uncharacterized protein n=1 Tax=Actinocrispum wychmicini TaxID=1213861 RepID=A0A4R2J3K0_9PSEU|nr:hypothetical protein [Actinocrispum wychmicini]TCO53121.1 hypothetical protein EV192_111318 [Actinocrispum wychmicini]
MNTTLPTPRDLPPHRQAEIRADLLRAAAGEQRRTRYAPIITGVAALGALAVIAVVLLVPTKRDTTPATPSLSSTTASTPLLSGTPSITPQHAPGSRPDPLIPGLPAEQRAAIEKGCGHSASQTGPVRLYNFVTDSAGQFALLYGDVAALTCTLGDADMPYNSGFSASPFMDWLTGPLSVDVQSSSVIAGRVDAQVAKVTYTNDNKTVDAVLANRTFVVRSTRQLPGAGTLQAYDANGRLLSTTSLNAQTGECYTTPDGVLIDPGGRDAPDPMACKTATPWR